MDISPSVLSPIVHEKGAQMKPSKGFYSFHFVDHCRKNKIWNDRSWENPAENQEAGGHRSYHQTSERLPDEEKDEINE